MSTQPSRQLETFPNPKPGRNYEITFECPEFTCVCPKTGQPDFAEMKLHYIPSDDCIELKSLKLYIGSFRNKGVYHEAVTNLIMDDVVVACGPRFARIEAAFNVRGGTYPIITVEYRENGWSPQPGSVLP